MVIYKLSVLRVTAPVLIQADARPRLHQPAQPSDRGHEMEKENKEVIAAILAAGIMANGRHARGHVVEDTDTVVSLYHSCLTALQKAAQEDRQS